MSQNSYPLARALELDARNRKALEDFLAAGGHDAVVVCVLAGGPERFSDNLRGPCSVCGDTVLFRPWVPAGVRKICLGCAPRDIEVSSAGDRRQ